MKVFLGLGNPGREHVESRHNIGSQCIDFLVRVQGLSLQRRFRVALAYGAMGTIPVVMAKSRVFMNLSGRAAKYLVDRFQLQPSDLVVIYDDMDLPLGKLRIRAQGSSAGHRGVESIAAFLGTQQFPRVRVGIGRPESYNDDVGHVLGKFAETEKEAVQNVVEHVGKAAEVLVTDGLDAAMNRFN